MTSTDNASIHFFSRGGLPGSLERAGARSHLYGHLHFYQCGEHKKGIRLGKKTGIGRFPGTQMFYCKSRFKGSTTNVVAVLTLTPILGAPPRSGLNSRPPPPDRRPEADESKRGRERSQGPLPSPTPLEPKTATWPVRSHDLAITQTLLLNVKDISPHILVPQTWSEPIASPLSSRSKVATCPFGSEKSGMVLPLPLLFQQFLESQSIL